MINVEIKARCTDEQHRNAHKYLKQFSNVVFDGIDHQRDTYFKVPNGRLKLREGNIENCLIQYERPDQSGPKVSKYRLVKFQFCTPIRAALESALGVLAVVEKSREIYYLDNVKIHLDHVAGLGRFLEIEARDESEEVDIDTLGLQCKALMAEFNVRPQDLIAESYSDLILKGN